MEKAELRGNQRIMTLGEHLEELRLRVIRSLVVLAVAFIAAWSVSIHSINMLERPALAALAEAGYDDLNVQFTTVTMPFLVRLSVALVLAALLAAPWFLIEIWMFVAAGLFPGERRFVRAYAPVSVALFAGGVCFAYLILLPVALGFLLGMISGIERAQPILIVRDYILFVIKFCFGAGLSFQLPLVIMFLVRTGLVPPERMRKSRRYALLGAFIVAALFTPPDPGTQILLVLPLVGLFELGLLLSGAGRKRTGT